MVDCRLFDDPLYDGSVWTFQRKTTEKDTEKGTVYEPLYPVEDDPTVAAMTLPEHLTVDDYFFPQSLRGRIIENKLNLSQKPDDWCLQEMRILAEGDEGYVEPDTGGGRSLYSVNLTFKVPQSNDYSDYVVQVLKNLSKNMFSTTSAEARGFVN